MDKPVDWQALWDANIGNRNTINYTFYQEVTAALEPVVHRLGPPTVSSASVPEDSYGAGFPPTYGVLITWNAKDVGWGYNAELIPIDLAKPSVGVLIGSYQNSCCIARVSSHPTWRITLSLFSNPRYHTMDQFVERCLETLPLSRFLAARLEPEHEKFERDRILSHGFEHLRNLVPNLDSMMGGPAVCVLRVKMAKAAIRAVVHAAVGWWLFSLGGLGEADIPNTFLAMSVLCKPVAETWERKQKEFWQMPVARRAAERNAFREKEPDHYHTFFEQMVDILADELANIWAKGA